MDDNKSFQFLYWFDFKPYPDDSLTRIVTAPSIEQAVSKFFRWANKKGNISVVHFEVESDGNHIDISGFKQYKQLTNELRFRIKLQIPGAK